MWFKVREIVSAEGSEDSGAKLDSFITLFRKRQKKKNNNNNNKKEEELKLTLVRASSSKFCTRDGLV